MYTGANGCEDELCDGDQDAADALVSDAKDLFAICVLLVFYPGH